MSKLDIWIFRGSAAILIAIVGYFAIERSKTREELSRLRTELTADRAEISSTLEGQSKQLSNIGLILTKDGVQAQLALFEEIIMNPTKLDMIELESKLRDGEVYKEVLEYLINARITSKE